MQIILAPLSMLAGTLDLLVQLKTHALSHKFNQNAVFDTWTGRDGVLVRRDLSSALVTFSGRGQGTSTQDLKLLGTSSLTYVQRIII